MESERNHCETPAFMKGVPGVIAVVDNNLIAEILRKASKMTGWEGKGFPGSVSVPMRTSNIKLLLEEDYVVSHKADGTRYMMWIESPGKVYFIGRNSDVFQVIRPLNFPAFHAGWDHLLDTLLDGEMIFWNNAETMSRTFKYMLFDIISIQGLSVNMKTHAFRRSLIQDGIINARQLGVSKRLFSLEEEPFVIEDVKFQSLTSDTLGTLLTESTPYETDGLIFTPVERPYNDWPTRMGVCENMLKWKPASLNTVDFILRIRTEENGNARIGNLGVSATAAAGAEEISFDKIELTPELEKLDGKVVECKKVDEKWVLLRERWDKSMPNTFQTTSETLESMKNGISKEQLIEFLRSSGHDSVASQQGGACNGRQKNSIMN